MTQSDINSILLRTGFPVAFDHFISAPRLPFITFTRGGTNNIFADNAVYIRLGTWRIYLATERKSPQTERVVESVLDAAGICWDIVDEFYVNSERLYQTIYEFTELEE